MSRQSLVLEMQRVMKDGHMLPVEVVVTTRNSWDGYATEFEIEREVREAAEDWIDGTELVHRGEFELGADAGGFKYRTYVFEPVVYARTRAAQELEAEDG